MAKNNPDKLTIFKPTKDNWHPSFLIESSRDRNVEYDDLHLLNYPDALVRVSLTKLFKGDAWRVCVWGADDTGMEIDFYEGWPNSGPSYTPMANGKRLAMEMFLAILNMDFVNFEDCKRLGMVPA